MYFFMDDELDDTGIVLGDDEFDEGEDEEDLESHGFHEEGAEPETDF